MEAMAKLTAVGVTAVVLSAVLKRNTPELALLLTLAAGLWMLTKLTVEICRSAGESGVAAFVETAGAVLALLVALPLVRAVAQLIGELLV